jgi:succinylglutamate desuccinylase
MAAVNLPLNPYSELPEGLLDTPAERLADILPGPALIHLPGRHERPLFVSVLLHGNETTGLHAVQALLRKHAGRTLPRALSLFIGNVSAAAHGLRRLDGQPDYNRVWPGTEHPPCPESALLAEVTEAMARREVFASVDVHNNTGLNPHYGCVTQLDHRHFWLASMFSRLVIYFTQPKGTQAAAFGALCPAVTLECGKPGHAHGAEHAFEYLDACLHLSEIPRHPVAPQDLDLYREVAQVMVREDLSFGFGREGLDLRLNEDIDHLNFTSLAAGTVLGEVSPAVRGLPLRVIADDGRDAVADYFAVEDGQLLLRKAVMPSMLTLDERVIGQDCLCYLMERAALD